VNAIEQAAREVEAASEERRLGPKHHAYCPDCMALLSISTDENGRTQLELVKHAAELKEQGK
jgi:hypothetical protein